MFFFVNFQWRVETLLLIFYIHKLVKLHIYIYMSSTLFEKISEIVDHVFVPKSS